MGTLGGLRALNRGAIRIIVLAAVTRLETGGRVTAFMVMAVLWGHNALAAGLIAMTATLPTILAGPIVGHLIDRYSPRRMFTVAGSLQFIGYCSFGWVVYSGRAGIQILIIAGLFLGTIQAIAENCINAALPEEVPADSLRDANSAMSTVQGIVQIGAPLVASVSAAANPLWTTSLYAALSLVNTVTSFYLPKSHRDNTIPRQVSGGRWIWKTIPVRVLAMTVALNNVAFGSMSAVLPVLAMVQLGLSPNLYGMAGSTLAMAGICGTVLVGVLRGRIPLPTWTRLSLVVQTAGFGAMLLASSLWPLLFALALLGLASGVWNVSSSTLLMEMVPSTVRGRVMATYRSVAFSGAPAGNFLGGLLGALAPVYGVTLSLAASLIGLSTLRLLKQPTIEELTCAQS